MKLAQIVAGCLWRVEFEKGKILKFD